LSSSIPSAILPKRRCPSIGTVSVVKCFCDMAIDGTGRCAWNTIGGRSFLRNGSWGISFFYGGCRTGILSIDCTLGIEREMVRLGSIDGTAILVRLPWHLLHWMLLKYANCSTCEE
jgi:hypothetical protein